MGKDKVVVSHPDIDYPVAVRYGWAENPVVNLYDRNGLPVTPFHVDLQRIIAKVGLLMIIRMN